MNAVEIFSIAGSIASIVLAVVAVALSVFFFSQSKNTESSVRESLADIKTQTDSLQKLTGRWMDRLTKYVTTPKSESVESSQELKELLKELPENIANQLGSPPQTNDPALVAELISLYIALYYYAGVANIFAQFSLPPLHKYDESPDFAALVTRVVDESAGDFAAMANLLATTDQEVLKQSKLFHLAEIGKNTYRDRVATSTQAYAKRAEEEQP